MPHLCVDARLIRCSGIGTFLKHTLTELPGSSLLHWKKDRDFLLQFKPKQLIEVKSSIYSLQEQIELPLRIPRCDLFWTPHFNIPLLPIRAQKRLSTIYDLFFLVNPCSRLKRSYAKLFYRAACRFSDHVTTISEFSHAEILQYFHPNNLTLIKLGVSSNFVPKQDKRIYEKYRLPKEYILTVSNGKPHKNIERLAQACLELNLNFVAVGKGRYVDDEDLPAVYSAASLFVFPSLYEGFGYPPLEAMACGCPVVVSNRASLPEVCGEAAEYVDPLNLTSIKQGILRALERRDDLIQRGFAHIKQRSAEECAREYRQFIRELM